jgi:hypothetical protein
VSSAKPFFIQAHAEFANTAQQQFLIKFEGYSFSLEGQLGIFWLFKN